MKEFVQSTMEVVGAVFVLAMFVVLAWIFLVITPDQCSAECDAVREKMIEMGWID